MASLSNPAQVGDYSVALAGTTGTACVQNLSRSFLMIQYVGTASGIFSFTNPTPASGSAGCFVLGTNSPPVVFSPVVPNGPVYYSGASGELVITQG
jgi:hypothetical protein